MNPAEASTRGPGGFTRDALTLGHFYPRFLNGDGGVTVAVRGWVKAMSELGYEAHVFGADSPNDAAERFTYHQVAMRRVGQFTVPRFSRSDTKKVDLMVLHSGWVPANVVAARFFSKIGLRYMIMPHGAYAETVFSRSMLKKKLGWLIKERRVFVQACAAHAVSEREHQRLWDLGFRRPVICAPHAVEVPDHYTWRGTQSDHILWLGRFDVLHKGLDLLVKAMALLPEAERIPLLMHGPDWRGGKQQIRDLIVRMRMQDWISVKPPIYGAEKWDALVNAKMFIYPSRWEVYGISMVEAYALGVPLITTDAADLASRLGSSPRVAVASPTPASLAEEVQGILRKIDEDSFGPLVVDPALCDWQTAARSFSNQLMAVMGC